ncbi:Hypothetical predicted protein [Mytilus galloprovincialis]|uniref:Endonuclease/exonuclease/phosphatase domain-containing protein n=1 Tax=Mytilus galloprovincialis TaxID=29158 RepID=A0A8B6HSB3_MYTGA|nr:Hypothetical predicted protein [Mytilus galloprovincialis]
MGKHTDRLNIISMKLSGRNGEQCQSEQKSYLNDVIWQNEPDMVFLPGDNPDMTSFALNNYRPVNLAFSSESVLLYDSKRLKLEMLNWFELIPTLTVPGVQLGKLIFPLMNILSPQPTQHTVKKFHAISWHWSLTQTKSEELEQHAASYLWLAQYLAWIHGVEVLIGGDFNYHPKLKDIDGSNPTEYFVASKEMQLGNTDIIAESKVSIRCAQSAVIKPKIEHERPPPIKTEMHIPARPPRHNGG